MEEIDQELYYEDFNTKQAWSRVVMFDLDSTLVHTKGRNIRPTGAHDWTWGRGVREKLLELAQKQVAIMIISNQSGMRSNQDVVKRDLIQVRIHNIASAISELGLPVYVWVAGAFNLFRKPNTTIFERYILPLLGKQSGLGEMKVIPYVGDAAGRKKDFSDSDRKFAYNMHILSKYLRQSFNITFFTPEEYFQGEVKPEKPLAWWGFDPQKFLNQDIRAITPLKYEDYLAAFLAQLHPPEVLLMVGPPAAGKSTLVEAIHKADPRYEIVSMDRGLTKAKCVSTMLSLLKEKKCVIVDNTSGSPDARASYIQPLKAAKVRYRIIWMCTYPDDEMANRLLYQHLNIVRERITGKPRIPDVAYHMFYKSYEPPDVSEGEIVRYAFIPSFAKDKHTLYFLQKS